MKRSYVTPAIAVEYYDLTQSIAACMTKINSLSSQCVIEDSDSGAMRDWAEVGWFVDGNCTEAAEGMEFDDGICYHTSVQIAFTSG